MHEHYYSSARKVMRFASQEAQRGPFPIEGRCDRCKRVTWIQVSLPQHRWLCFSCREDEGTTIWIVCTDPSGNLVTLMTTVGDHDRDVTQAKKQGFVIPDPFTEAVA